MWLVHRRPHCGRNTSSLQYPQAGHPPTPLSTQLPQLAPATVGRVLLQFAGTQPPEVLHPTAGLMQVAVGGWTNPGAQVPVQLTPTIAFVQSTGQVFWASVGGAPAQGTVTRGSKHRGGKSTQLMPLHGASYTRRQSRRQPLGTDGRKAAYLDCATFITDYPMKTTHSCSFSM